LNSATSSQNHTRSAATIQTHQHHQTSNHKPSKLARKLTTNFLSAATSSQKLGVVASSESAAASSSTARTSDAAAQHTTAQHHAMLAQQHFVAKHGMGQDDAE
jgi:hypothetical protein